MNTEQTNDFYVLSCNSNNKNHLTFFWIDLWIYRTNSNTKLMQFLKLHWFSVRKYEMFYGHFNKIKLVNVLI